MIPAPCASCPSHGARCVPGRGPVSSSLLLCGEAPGKDEEKQGRCWVGKAGRELGNYLTMIARIDVDACYLTNLVKFHPPRDRDPKSAEIVACGEVLDQEVDQVNPRVVAALGRYSTQYFLRDHTVSLERVHGIPLEIEGRIILPMYHPAAGMHNTTLMTQIVEDFTVLGEVVRGVRGPGCGRKGYPLEEHCDYRLAESVKDVQVYLINGPETVAIDTESVKIVGRDGLWHGEMGAWCVSVSICPGTARVIRWDDAGSLAELTERTADPCITTILHNAMYDLPILSRLGIHPARYYDTMVMAYLTQSLPQSLKDLAYRLCGMRMDSYEEIVREAGRRNAAEYLLRVAGVEWPRPEPELVWEKGIPRVRRGWPLHKRVERILRDVERGEVDAAGRWRDIEGSLRGPAEEQFGLLPPGDLAEVGLEAAVQYSGRDADATLQVFPPLMERVEGMNIERQMGGVERDEPS